MKNTKVIKFDYNGGDYTQKLNISGVNLPWRYECDVDWLSIETTTNSLTVNVEQMFDFKDRECLISIFDKFNNELKLIVIQTGYQDLSIECTDSVVLYENFYYTNPEYNIYVSVYGGVNQEFIYPKELKPYISKVWDNSLLYNDYTIKVPQTLNGSFTIKHKDADEFIKYCKKHDLPYNIDKLQKTISIQQVTEKDVIGEIIIECEGKQYSTGDDCILPIFYNKDTEINIISTAYTHIDSKKSCHIINDRKLDIQDTTNWVNYISEVGKIILRANSLNTLDERISTLRFANPTNSHQVYEIKIKQDHLQ